MLAMLLSAGLFLFWLLVGHAVFCLLGKRAQLRDHLAAPVVGIAVTLLPTYFLNRLGIPIAGFGLALLAILALAGVATTFCIRFAFDFRAYAPFAALLAGTLIAIGAPMLEFGFDWISYCNSDMANYCFAAHRFHDFGFDQVPTEDSLILGKDYSQVYWFFHSCESTRPGADLVLAWVMTFTGLSATQIYMPVIVAFHLVLLSATASLVCYRPENKWMAWWSCLLLSLSALTALGTYYQLIAQVVGVAVLAVLSSYMLRSFAGLSSRAVLREGFLIGILGTSQLLLYQEVGVFLFIAFVFHRLLLWRECYTAWRPLACVLGLAGFVYLAILNLHFFGPFEFLRLQAGRDDAGIALYSTIFTHYLIPSGLPTLWGLGTLGVPWMREPISSLLIAISAVLLAWSAWATISLSRKGQPYALVLLGMFGLGVYLSVRCDGFGLFKLAMFVQPFLLATVTAWCWQFSSWPRFRLVPLVLIALGGLVAQNNYREASRGRNPLYVEVPKASTEHLLSQLRAIHEATAGKKLVVDTTNEALTKLLALHCRGNVLHLPGAHCFFMLAGDDGKNRVIQNSDRCPEARPLSAALVARHPKLEFDLHDPLETGKTNPFRFNLVGLPSQEADLDDYVLVDSLQMTVWNRHAANRKDHRYFDVRPMTEVSNHLVYVPSDLATVRFLSQFSVERDPVYNENNMVGCGQYLLFQILRPSDQVRVRMEMTASLRVDGENCLPQAFVIGADRKPLDAPGRGAARIFSAPLKPQMIDGHACLGLDMGSEARQFTEVRKGLMAAYGSKYLLDHRKLVAFLRDVSLVTEEQYAALQPPSALQKFPRDLLHPDLEFSGIYEDGYLSESSFFKLTRPRDATALVLRGMIPRLDNPDFTTVLTVLVDGKTVATRQLGPGKFEIEAPPGNGTGSARVEYLFSRWQIQPEGRRRPVAALVSFIGFTNSAAIDAAPADPY